MAEPIDAGPVALRTSPLAHLADRMRAAAVTGARGVTLAERPFVTMVNLRLDPASEAADRVEKTLGRHSRESAATPPRPAPGRSSGSAPTSGSCCPKRPSTPPSCGRHSRETRARSWTSRRIAPRWS
ncbi:hypothetical protein SVIO_105800 [Streptomyces violaceusniger]|uniref:Uncharacterized protein n=1 Tax=Streptomyces violaceusniger TaxID=68280 RepID=A0A4D4LNW9_STRVO|nr:hypothetical protein SVIO_105800 [Streptomyces violaceusniger]